MPAGPRDALPTSVEETGCDPRSVRVAEVPTLIAERGCTLAWTGWAGIGPSGDARQ